MLMEQFGDRLYRLRKEHNMTIDEFVKEMNKRYPESKLNKSMVSRYENNVHKPKRFSLVQEISEFYGVSTDYLMCRSEDKYKQGSGINCKRIPILGTIACGQAILAQEHIEGYEYIPEDFNADFCLYAKGDSMIGARILDGDLVYIHQQQDVEDGEIAAVLMFDRNEATLKRVYKLNGSIILRAENPNYKEHIYKKKEANNIKIIGKAVSFKSEVR